MYDQSSGQSSTATLVQAEKLSLRSSPPPPSAPTALQADHQETIGTSKKLGSAMTTPPPSARGSGPVELPQELVRLFLEQVGDWELATTLGVRCPSLNMTAPWQEFATPLAIYTPRPQDKAILRSSTSITPVRFAIAHASTRFSQWGTRVMIRFGYIHVLEYLLQHDPHQLRGQCRRLLPVVASAWGRVNVLQWAREGAYGLDPDSTTIAESMDEASRHGQVAALDFWKDSGLTPSYTEAALLSATIQRQKASLEWWRNSGLDLKIGPVLDYASKEGTLEYLDWWANSGLPCPYSKAALRYISQMGNIALLDWWKHSRFKMDYDKDVILIATRYGQTRSLTWWLESGLDVEYRFFDIEEALEDSVMGKDESQKWWEGLGYDVGMSQTEWTRVRNFKVQWKELGGWVEHRGRRS
ncbi:BQ5605_C019g08860 [Microbotryum silenes-dioicae]|uniref:BQ5605_C019g08860 protein n=1 Tax=Microbotryum silenes-dioicae TaxID=796604 RepID=A0A2X0LW15_9BASI|nr:BQ5605_C019g08860 [Microbotryum silenes-dioicae]